MKKTTIFKKLVNDKEILTLPVPLDALSARIIEKTGFKALCAAGFAASATLLGKPDIALLSMTEMTDYYARIVEAVDIPVFVDADTGHGGILNAQRTIRRIEAAGAVGMFIEDQVFPKRCGHMAGKDVVPVEEMLAKLKAVLDARQDDDFMIMARTDALGVHGLEEALHRARLYEEAGADMIFVEAPRTVEEMKAINRAVKAPTLANIIEGGQTPELTTQELEDLGFAMATYPCTAAFTVAKAVGEMMTELKTKGTTSGAHSRLIPFEGFLELLGLNDLRELEASYFKK